MLTPFSSDGVHHALFFFYDTATTEIYTLSLHDALPISCAHRRIPEFRRVPLPVPAVNRAPTARDRKRTRLNSSHVKTSYAVFCLKKKNRFERRASIHHR